VGHESGHRRLSGKIHKDDTHQPDGQMTLLRVEQNCQQIKPGAGWDHFCHVHNVAPVAVKVVVNGMFSKTLQPGESWAYAEVDFFDYKYFYLTTVGGTDIVREKTPFELTAEREGEAVGMPTRETWTIQLLGYHTPDLDILRYTHQPSP
jgi:hypothetical protein